MKRWALITITASAIFCTAEAQESFGDLEGSVASKEFTQAERRYFTEALDRYQKYELHGDFKIRSNIAWLDNDHIVFSARKLPGWEATANEHSRIMSMNVVTGEYKDTGYRGRLMCLNHQGDMMVRQGGSEAFPDSSKTRYEWWIGTWGGELTSVPRPDNSSIPSYLCRFAPYGDQIYTTPKEKIREGMHRTLPLLPEHGYFRETVEYIGEKATYPVHHIKRDGSMRLVTNKVPIHSNFIFYPWMNTYYDRLPLRYKPRIFHISGEFSYVGIPKLLAYWSKSSPSMDAIGVLTKAGMLWTVHHGYGDWKKQGLYLDTTGGLMRVDIGVGADSIVSPDGCKVMDVILREDPFGKFPRAYVWLIVDFCKGK